MDGAPLPEGLSWSVEAGGIGVVTLSRPPVNALNWTLKRGLRSLLASLSSDRRVRTVIFRSGLPNAFCAGSDLAELVTDHARPGSATERTRFELELWGALSALPQPSVAAIEGHALGSGVELAIACDFRIAGASASLGLPEVKTGGAPGVQTLCRLPAMVGLARARRMLLLGEPLSADEAEVAGLVDEVVPDLTAFDAALRLAHRLADLPSSSMQFLKQSLAASLAPGQDAVGAAEFGAVEKLFQAPEMQEGIAAFLAKRPADFRAAVGWREGPCAH